MDHVIFSNLVCLVYLDSYSFFHTFEVIQPENENGVIEVSLSFSCKNPISSVVKLKFTDEQNREYYYNVTVTADNSLFTCHAFLADHQTDYQIIVENVC